MGPEYFEISGKSGVVDHDVEGVVFQEKLYMGGSITKWNKRFCILSKNRFYLYSSQDDVSVRAAKIIVHLWKGFTISDLEGYDDGWLLESGGKKMALRMKGTSNNSKLDRSSKEEEKRKEKEETNMEVWMSCFNIVRSTIAKRN